MLFFVGAGGGEIRTARRADGRRTTSILTPAVSELGTAVETLGSLGLCVDSGNGGGGRDEENKAGLCAQPPGQHLHLPVRNN